MGDSYYFDKSPAGRGVISCREWKHLLPRVKASPAGSGSKTRQPSKTGAQRVWRACKGGIASFLEKPPTFCFFQKKGEKAFYWITRSIF